MISVYFPGKNRKLYNKIDDIWRERPNKDANSGTSWIIKMLRGENMRSGCAHPRYQEIVSLYKQGIGGRAIARELGIGKNPVYRVLSFIKGKGTKKSSE